MWKGLKKALGSSQRSSKAQKTGSAADVSQRSTSSAGALFQLDMAELDGLVTLHDKQAGQQQQAGQGAPDPQQQQQQPAAARTWAALQQQLEQQAAVQQLVSQTDDSTSKRRAAAQEKRINNAMLNPSACLYQISSLLSLSTLFEHKLQRDTLTALQQQQPAAARLLHAVGAGCPTTSDSCPVATQQQQQQLQRRLDASGDGACTCCWQQGCGSAEQGGSSLSSFCSCGAAGGPAPRRSPSATAGATVAIARRLSGWGYRVIVRKVLHSKAYWTKAMDNTFIVALDSSSGGHVEYVVDPHFKEAFNVGVMSDNYSAVWQALPQVFVGMPCQLQSVVQLLCEEMELSFLEAGRPCPPWRGWAATINRWMSDQFVDILVPPPGAPQAEVDEFMARCAQPASACGAAGGGGGASTASSAATRASSYAGGSTCSPLGGGTTSQRLGGDRVHVSSVLSSVSGRERRVQEPLHQLRGFSGPGTVAPVVVAAQAAGHAAPLQQQMPQGELVSSDEASDSSQMAHTAAAGESALAPEQQPAGSSTCVGPEALDGCSRAASVSSTASCSSSEGGPALRSRSLLTAQMQFRQQLELSRRQAALPFMMGGGAALQPTWPIQAAAPGQVLPMSQQAVAAAAQQQQQVLAQMQQAQAALQLQQQAAAVQQVAGPPLLQVVHTVRPCGAVQQQQPAAAVPQQHVHSLQQQLAAVHAAQQLAPQQPQHHHQQEGSLYQHAQEQPRLLRLLHRPKPT